MGKCYLAKESGLEETGLGDGLKGGLRKSYMDGPLRGDRMRLFVFYIEAY